MPSTYYKPSEALSKYVLTYFLLENEAIPDHGFPITVYPNGNVILGIVYGKTLPVMTDKGQSFIVPTPGISGQYTHPVSIRFFDDRALITIFKPFGFYYVFGIPHRILLNQTIALKTLGISGYEEIVGKISKAHSIQDKIDFLENWLLKMILKNKVTPVGLPEYLLNKIILNKGIVPLKSILTDLHLNSRYIERCFNQYVGMSAKEFAKIIRFSSIANYLINHPTADNIELCEKGNLYDSSHLIKEFNKYTGFTPAHFLDKILNEGENQIEALKRLNIAQA